MEINRDQEILKECEQLAVKDVINIVTRVYEESFKDSNKTDTQFIKITPVEMKFRWHKSGLKESLKTVELFSDMNGLLNILSKNMVSVSLKDIKIKPYCYDDRINWNTHIVLFKGDPLGFTNCALAEILGGNND
jgi:hypothetical protein